MYSQFRTRAAQGADRSVVDDLRTRGITWECGSKLDILVEFEHRVVAAASAEVRQTAAPRFVPEPVPELEQPFEPGSDRTLIGRGLVVARGLDPDALRVIHRIVRTLASQEAGARWSFCSAPIPHIDGYSPGSVVQQIAAGAVGAPLVSIPMRDGYWPIGTSGGHVVLVRRNEEF